jgi:hypothetical protein
MRSRVFPLLLFMFSTVFLPQAQLKWSKQDFGGSFEQVDRTDFNGDGFPDLLLYEQQDFIATQINSGSGTVASRSSLQQHFDRIAFLDFNGDHKMDVAGCNSSENVVILEGGGDGTLTPAQTLTVPCSWVVASDFNRDGKPDIAVGIASGSSITTTNQVIVYLGDGSGGIAAQVLNDNVNFSAADGRPCNLDADAKAADFTGDKIADIFIIGNCLNDPFNVIGVVIVGRGDGTGHFTFHKDLEGAFPQRHLRLLDENQDGKRDLMSSNGTDLSIFNGHGNGTFTLKNALHTNYSAADNLGEFVDAGTVADYDGDGSKDAIVAIEDIGPNFSRFLRFYKGQPDGSYKAIQALAIGVPVRDMISGDFDKDGRVDLLMSRPGAANNLWLNVTPSAHPCAASSALRSIRVCAAGNPAGNFHFVSSPLDGQPIHTLQIYLDGALKFETPEDILSKNLQLTDGAHRLTVKAWDDTGSFSTTRTLISCTNSNERTVRICSPEDEGAIAGSGAGPQVHIVASAATSLKFTAVQVYVDGVLTFKSSAKSIDTFAPLSSGRHRITVKAWDSSGPFSNSITVVAQ